MKDFELSVTICSWNTQADLRACLQSLNAERDSLPMEVIVVDNASHDGSPDMVESEFPWVRLLRQTKNLGFTGGHNVALRACKGRHRMLLNSDTVVHAGALAKLVETLNANPDIGIVGPKLLYPDGSLQLSCRTFPNPVAALFRNTFIGRLFPKNRWVRAYLMQDWDHRSERDVDWVSGAALLMSEAAADELGTLDEDYFMFCEDVDLCLRCWNSGRRVRYIPDAVITHAIGRSTSQATNAMIVRFHKSMYLFFKKHQVRDLPLLIRPLALGFAATALTARGSLFILKNKWDALRWRLRGH